MSESIKRLSVAPMPLENRWDIIQYTAIVADELGYDTFSLPETWAYDTTVLLSNLSTHTKRIRLATTIVGVWGRSAATIAMAAASMNIVSNGRFVLGIGASTPQLALGLHDTPFEKPYTKTKQMLTQIRALLNGDRIPLSNGANAHALRLNVPAQPEVPIILGATSPRSIQLAGQYCDGWIPFFYARDLLHEGIQIFEEGRRQSHDPSRPYTIMPSLPVVVHKDPEKAREGAAWFVAFYIMSMGTIYRDTLIRMGFADEVQAVIDSNQDRRPAIVPHEADRLLDQLTIYGTPDQACEQLEKWYTIDNVAPGLLLLPNLSHSEIRFTLEALRPSFE